MTQSRRRDDAQSESNANGARPHPDEEGPTSAMDQVRLLAERAMTGRLVFFLDYDGTLTPIVNRPENALLSEEMRDLLDELACRATVTVVSGRDLTDVQEMVGLEDLLYAGSHGFDIAGPGGLLRIDEEAQSLLPELDAAEEELTARLATVPGARLERKKFAIAVHYREVAEEHVRAVETAVDRVLTERTGLRRRGGKKVFELQPDVDWHKGRAVEWILERLGWDGPDVLPVYIGNDVTDEDAFETLRERGVGIRVGVPDEATLARHVLADTDEVLTFLQSILDRMGEPDTRRGPRHREVLPWELAYREWEPEEQSLREALCALGNGNVVTRGAFEESPAGEVHYPGTYLAGGYNRLETEVSGRILTNEDLVNWPNWLSLTFRVGDDEWFAIDQVEVLDFDFRLDVEKGVLTREVRFRDPGGRESILTSRRFVHMVLPHMAAIQWNLKPLNWEGEIEIRSGLDGSVINDNVARYRELSSKHLEVLGSGVEGDDGIYLTVQTNQSRKRMTQAARTRVTEDGTPAPTLRSAEFMDEAVAHRLHVQCREGRTLTVEKVVSIRSSSDSNISETEVAARQDIRRAGTFDQLLESHVRRWRNIWDIADIELQNGDVQTQLILRLHIFHLLQSVSLHTIDRDAGVPARGWHGEAYRGHIFWDELFIFPLLAFHVPEVTRGLLMYRYRRLQEARFLAREAGFRGAMYPWQSGSDGREETQVLHLNPKSGRWVPDTTHRQRHVNAAIAYNVWNYFKITDDVEFMDSLGAEMILEIARFWASLAEWDPHRERYVIEGVVGPDEFHTQDPNREEPGLANNAYTNVMASWVLRCALRVLDLLDEERTDWLKQELALTEMEISQWKHMARKLLIPFHDDGIVSQFEGYAKLEEFDWDGYRSRYDDIHRLDRILEAEGDDVNCYKASKQADVLMLFYLFSFEELEDLFGYLGYQLTRESYDRTVAYYMARTSHGSTLSQIVHAWVLARKDRSQAWSFWQQALHSDIDDIQGGTTPEGIHLGAMAGTVDIIHRGHTGMVIEEEGLRFDPLLPEEISDVRMRMRYRGNWLTLHLERKIFQVSVDRGPSPAVRVAVGDTVANLSPGESHTFHLD